jgi:hypothetical protein
MEKGHGLYCCIIQKFNGIIFIFLPSRQKVDDGIPVYSSWIALFRLSTHWILLGIIRNGDTRIISFEHRCVSVSFDSCSGWVRRSDPIEARSTSSRSWSVGFGIGSTSR